MDYLTVLTSQSYGKLLTDQYCLFYKIIALHLHSLHIKYFCTLFMWMPLLFVYYDSVILIYYCSKHYSLLTIQFLNFSHFWLILWFLSVSDLFLFYTCCVYCWSRLDNNQIGDLGVQHLSQDGLRHCPNLQVLS